MRTISSLRLRYVLGLIPVAVLVLWWLTEQTIRLQRKFELRSRYASRVVVFTGVLVMTGWAQKHLFSIRRHSLRAAVSE